MPSKEVDFQAGGGDRRGKINAWQYNRVEWIEIGSAAPADDVARGGSTAFEKEQSA
jgi:hypothetical protein